MIDGNKRKRRNGTKGQARMKWYADYRNARFAARFAGLKTFKVHGQVFTR